MCWAQGLMVIRVQFILLLFASQPWRLAQSKISIHALILWKPFALPLGTEVGKDIDATVVEFQALDTWFASS